MDLIGYSALLFGDILVSSFSQIKLSVCKKMSLSFKLASYMEIK